MSKDKLEIFIQENRGDFDAQIPNLGLWAKIDQELQPSRVARQRFPYLARYWAAGVLLLLGLGLGGYGWLNKTSPEGFRTHLSPVAFVEQYPEMAEVHEYFHHEINKHKGQLAAMNHHDPALYRDLKHLESHFDTLYEEWLHNPHKSSGDKLMDAMIANYHHRHHLLDRAVQQLQWVSGSKSPPALHLQCQGGNADTCPVHQPGHCTSRPKDNQIRFKYYSYEDPYADLADALVSPIGHTGSHRY